MTGAAFSIHGKLYGGKIAYVPSAELKIVKNYVLPREIFTVSSVSAADSAKSLIGSNDMHCYQALNLQK